MVFSGNWFGRFVFCILHKSWPDNSGFPLALENGWKQIHAWKNHGILTWDGFLDVNVMQIFLANFKKSSFSLSNRAIKKSSLYHETEFSTLIQLFMQYLFLSYILPYTKKEGGMPYFEWSWRNHGILLCIFCENPVTWQKKVSPTWLDIVTCLHNKIFIS